MAVCPAHRAELGLFWWSQRKCVHPALHGNWKGKPWRGANLTMSENNGKVEHRYDFSDSQAGKDICDRRIATVKSHIRCYINEGHDIKSAGDLRLLLILTVVSKGAR